KPNLCGLAGENAVRGTLMDGTSRLRLPDGTALQHGLMTACFADRAVVAAGGAVPLPDGLPLWQSALLGCGVVTGLGAVRNVAAVKAGESVAVFGCGGVGLQVVAGRGSRVRRRSSPSTAWRRSSSLRANRVRRTSSTPRTRSLSASYASSP